MSERRVPVALRREVGERASGLCEYCRCPASFSSNPFAVEHVIPKVRGGDSTTDNLALSCQGCNNHKYDKVEGIDPTGGILVRLYHPRHDRWRDHFAWSDDFTSIVGVSPTGRATIVALRLNRESVVNLRKLLIRVGKHPPPDSTG
jgi:5-methylcytosine-specific restriction endonuclease McrA